jgi:hypothetical protein
MITFRKMTFVYLLIGFLSTGAMTNSNQDNQIPCDKKFWDLYRAPYRLGFFDCSNKCAIYQRALEKQGVPAEVVVIKPDRSNMHHALVRVERKQNRNNFRYYDPTKGILLETLSQTGVFVRVMSKTELSKELKQAKQNNKDFAN